MDEEKEIQKIRRTLWRMAMTGGVVLLLIAGGGLFVRKYMTPHWTPNRDRLIFIRKLWSDPGRTCPEAVILGSSMSQQLFGPLNDLPDWSSRIFWFTYEGARPLELWLLLRDLILPRCNSPTIMVEVSPSTLSTMPFSATDVLDAYLSDADIVSVAQSTGTALKVNGQWHPRLLIPPATTEAADLGTAMIFIGWLRYWFYASPIGYWSAKAWGGSPSLQSREYVGGVERQAAGRAVNRALVPSPLHIEALRRIAHTVEGKDIHVTFFSPPTVDWYIDALRDSQSLAPWCEAIAAMQSLPSSSFLDFMGDKNFTPELFNDFMHVSEAGAWFFLKDELTAATKAAASNSAPGLPAYCTPEVEADAAAKDGPAN